MSIERKNPNRGYHADNIEAITLSENSRRQFVPFFKNKSAEEAAIRETQKAIAREYPELKGATL